MSSGQEEIPSTKDQVDQNKSNGKHTSTKALKRTYEELVGSKIICVKMILHC